MPHSLIICPVNIRLVICNYHDANRSTSAKNESSSISQFHAGAPRSVRTKLHRGSTEGEVIPKALRADLRGGFPRARFSDSIGAGGFAPCHQRSDCERTIRRRSFERLPAGRRTSTRAVGFCRWRRFGTGWTEARRRRSAAWIARRCATGSTASTPRGRRACIDNRTEGPKPRLSEEQLAQFAKIVEAGPDREKDGVVRWRRIDLKRVIAERFGVDFHPRYVGKLLKKLGFSHISARPRHPTQDERIVEGFKKTSRAR